MVIQFYRRDDSGVNLVAELAYPDVWIREDALVKKLLESQFMLLGGKFDYNNEQHHAALPEVINGSRLWAVTVDYEPIEVYEDEKVRNWDVDDQLNRDWMKMLLRLTGKKEDDEKGFFFKDETGRVIFAGGPSSGGGMSIAGTSFVQAASEGKISNESHLGGGVTDTSLVEYIDDGKGVWKAVDVGHDFHDGNSEVAAYRLNKLLGGDEVPETIYAEKDGVKGTSQAFIEGARGLSDNTIYDMDKDARDRIVAMDIIVGQVDRHWGNVVVGPDGKVWAIDNGHASWYDQRNPKNLTDLVDSNVMLTESYQIERATMNALKSITREEFDSIFLGVGQEKHVNQEMGWSNLQMILELDGKIEI